MAGLVGAVVGAVAFDLVGAFAFPLAKTDSPISQTWATRLLARLLVTIGTAASLALLLTGPRNVAPVSCAETAAPSTEPPSPDLSTVH